MPRRLWLGSSKGQFTTYPTNFVTNFITSFLVPTSQSTPYITYYPTTYLYPVNTQYLFNTTVLTPYTTSHQTSRISVRSTEYVYNTYFDTSNITNYITYYTYPVETAYPPSPTTYAVYSPTSIHTSAPAVTTYAVYTPTQYDVPVAGYYYPANTSQSTTGVASTGPTSTYCSFNADGTVNGNGPYTVAGCQVAPEIISFNCDGGTPSYATAPYSYNSYYYTYISTSTTTAYTTSYESSYNTFFLTYYAGLTDPTAGFTGCYDVYLAAEYCGGSPDANCIPCTASHTTSVVTSAPVSSSGTRTTTYDTGILTSAVVSGVTTYVQRVDYSCTDVQYSYSYNTVFSTQYYQPPYVSSYSVNTYVGNTSVPYTTFYDSVFLTYVGNTSYDTTRSAITQYPTSNPTSRVTTYQTTDVYGVPTNTNVTVFFTTFYDTDYETQRQTDAIVETQYPSDVTTSHETTRVTSWDTQYDQNTTRTTSRSTTWFTE